jgi:Uncharacterised nucleotidyltransferase
MSASPVQPIVSPREQSPTAALSTLSAEFEFLLICCSDLSDTDRERRIRAILRQPIDWQHFIEAAEDHGVLPRVSQTLSSLTDFVPAAPLQSIRRHYEANVQRTLWLTKELARVVRHLESHSIPTLPYKGPVLAELLYGNVTRRQFSDLDILIHSEDFSRAKVALQELGFEPGMELTVREERAYLRSGYEFTFDSANGRNLLEIQWQMMPRFYSVDFKVDEFFERAVTQDVGGLAVRSLCVEDLLLVLCAHAAKHAWIQLSWLCEIADLAKSPEIDWASVWRQAHMLGIQRMVSVTFSLAQRLLGAPLPTMVQEDANVKSLTAVVIPIIQRSVPFDTETMAYFRLMASSRERRLDRARFWWRLATTPTLGEWSAVRLPAPLFPLYHVVRVIRLARRIY